MKLHLVLGHSTKINSGCTSKKLTHHLRNTLIHVNGFSLLYLYGTNYLLRNT